MSNTIIAASPPSVDAVQVLADIRKQLPGGQERAGQDQMISVVQNSIRDHVPSIVQAGTGVGKSLAYLIPSILSGQKVVVVTASIALQDQLDKKDLPFLAEHMPHPFSWAVLKGRSNYWCLQKEDEFKDQENSLFDDEYSISEKQQIQDLATWSQITDSGDKAQAPLEADYKIWSLFSSTSTECPGQKKCARGEDCWAEKARSDASAAQVIVVNTHLWGAHLAHILSGQGYVIPPHDIVIIDEAHEMPDIVSSCLGKDLHPGDLTAVGKALQQVVEDAPERQQLVRAAQRLRTALDQAPRGRMQSNAWEDPRFADVLKALQNAEIAVIAANNALGDKQSTNERFMYKKLRLSRELAAIQNTIVHFLDADDQDYVSWIDTGKICNRPISVDKPLAQMWQEVTPILCSATIHAQFGNMIGLKNTDIVRVSSPFNFKKQGILYVPETMPDPPKQSDGAQAVEKYEQSLYKHVETLVAMSHGRAMVLCTSNKRMQAVYDYLMQSPKITHHIFKQGELPKPALLSAYKDDVHSILVATRSFWTGVDIQGDALSMLIIDKLPFPTPDDPVLQARRERFGGGYKAFELVDIPQAAIILAQGVGRLIRSEKDTGVVAVLDTRLATARYRHYLLTGLPPFRRIRNLDKVRLFLERMDQDAEAQTA